MNNNQLIEIKQAANDAWLGIFAKEHTLFNPLENIPPVYRNDPHLYFTYLMSRPEYFSFICKELLNITIYPFQSVILNEVWNHQFPMLVASRGASKCLHYDTLILTNKGIKKIGDIVNSEGKVYFGDLKVYSESGWQKVEYGWCNGVKDTVIIELKNGLEVECTLNHPLRKGTKDKSVWCNAEDLKIGDCIKLLAPDSFNETSSYTEEYAFSLSTMFESQTEFPESVYNFSKETLRIYVESLGVVNKKFRKISHFSKKMIKELQVLAFWATGKKTKSTYSEGAYHLYIYDNPAKYSSIESIKPSRTKTYDLHLYEDHSFLSNGMVSHNSYTLALYALLRAILLPGRKIIIVGSVFRQSKVIFNYLTKMYQNAPLLRDSNPGKGPKMYPDRCELQIGDSLITALPIGSGDTIRGYRSNDTLSDEFSSQSAEIFETVIAGFSSVSQDPVKNTQEAAALAFLKSINQPTNIVKKDEFNKDNQIVLTGSAYYYFNHFAQYWEKWRSIIYSRGNEEKLNEIFKGEIPLGFDWKDYSIIRIPYQLLPVGFMSDANIARSKATMTSGIFEMEFAACQTPDTEIVTKKGIKNIINIEIGDEVLTHKNRFKKVTKKTCRPYIGKLVELDLYGYYKNIKFTPEHPFFKNQDFIEINEIEDNVEYCPNYELSNLQEIDLRDFTENYIEVQDKIYPKSGNSKHTNEDRKSVLRLYDSGLTQKQISDKLNLKYNTVFHIVKSRNHVTKSSIYKKIKLDYNLGLIIGYYASEGSTGSDGKITSFSLDGHQDLNLKYFIDELSLAIEKTIGIKPKLYNHHKDNTCNVTINSRIFVDFIKSICPGLCYSKIIKHEILFSNEDFMRGFIVGMFNGDGHKRDFVAKLSLTNSSLVNQVKMVLEYFGIVSSFCVKSGKEDQKFPNGIYNTRDIYRIDIHKEFYKKFLNVFYNQDYIFRIKNKHKNIFNKDFNINYKIRKKEYIDYDGMVYNLEVEDDNSYSLPCATVHNCFSKDSNGFFKASSIENATANKENNIILPSSAPEPIIFEPKVKGDPGKQYVFGVDPASEVDNFSIVIIEIGPDHNKIVYCWTTNAKKFKRKLQKGLIDNKDYYGFTCRKIRDLMKDFNCVHLAIDAQGGGKAVYEAFHDDKSIEDGELPLWEIIESDKKKDSDGEAGLHIVQLAQFSNYEYLSSANHNLKKDIEDKTLLFPRYSAALLTFENAMSGIDEEDLEDTSIYDTLEDCIIEVQELKSELAQIVVTNTVSGRERWDTPETKISGSKKGRARKDRYSALLMANAAARKFMRGENNDKDLNLQYTKTQDKTLSFIGPKWATDPLSELYND